MVIEYSVIEGFLKSGIMPLFRISGMIMVMPIFGSKLVPNKIKIATVIALTLAIAPNVEFNDFTMFSIEGFLIALNQLIIGIIFGVVLQVIFQAFIIGGQLVAMQMGLGFASMMDPQNGVSVPVIGQLYLMVVTLLFLSVNGHLAAIEVLAQSFNTIPIGLHSVDVISIEQMISWGSWLFLGGLKIAIPGISILFLVNISFGVMTKAAPQLNIFSIGFPFTMLFGIVILWLTLGALIPGFEMLMDLTFNYLGSLAKVN